MNEKQQDPYQWENADLITAICTNSLLILMNLATFYHVWNGSAYKIILKIVALQITASLCFVVGIVSFREIDETNENEP